MQDPLVIFIAGWGRSGTTLLDRLLGSGRGAFSAGEVRYLWDRGLIEKRVCSCGEPVADCPVWSWVAERSLRLPVGSIEALVRVRDRFRTRDLWRRRHRELTTGAGGELAGYIGSLAEVFHRLRRRTGRRIIVDSSKFPSHGYLLRHLPGSRLLVVQLVRDPRGVAFSWQRRKVYDETGDSPRLIERHRPVKSALYWMIWNLTIERFLTPGEDGARKVSYTRVSYEDLAARPRETVEGILNLVDSEPRADCFVSSNEASLAPGHLIAGNPMRFRAGRVVIEADESWQREMPLSSWLAVSLVTAPLLRRYGYSWTRGARVPMGPDRPAGR